MFNRIVQKVRQIKERLVSDRSLEEASGFYWNMSSRDARVKDQSHWCGAQRWRRERWFAYGDFFHDLIIECLRKFAPQNYIQEFKQKTALEWGCGGGAVARPLCGSFSKVYGVDISRASVYECERQMLKLGHANFIKLPIPSADPEMILREIEKESIDLVVSIGVFQHFPSKSYTRRVLDVMGKILEKGGYALLQVRYFDGSPKLCQKERDYAQNVIYMTSFTPEEFAEQLKGAGFSILTRERDIDGQPEYHDYYFIKKEDGHEPTAPSPAPPLRGLSSPDG
jgi:hypothetical protein